MKSGTVLIAGATGLVGAECLKAFQRSGDALGASRRHQAPAMLHLDLTQTFRAGELLTKVRPRAVVCAAADPNVEGCEADPVTTRRINVEGTLRLAEAAARVGAHFVFFSSEYVFDGSAGPYSEEGLRNPLSEYGRQKAECEKALPTITDRFLVVRTSGVFGWHPAGKNFVMQLVHRLSRGDAMRVPYDQMITPIHAAALANGVERLVNAGITGIVHVAAAAPLSRLEFARMAARTFGLESELVMSVSTASLGLKAARPRSAGLLTSYAASLLGAPLPDAQQSLHAMCSEAEVPDL